MSQLTGQLATTCTVTSIRLHLTTQFTLYLSMPAGFSYTSPSAAACGASLQACTLLPTDRTAAALPFGYQLAESCFT